MWLERSIFIFLLLLVGTRVLLVGRYEIANDAGGIETRGATAGLSVVAQKEAAQIRLAVQEQRARERTTPSRGGGGSIAESDGDFGGGDGDEGEAPEDPIRAVSSGAGRGEGAGGEEGDSPTPKGQGVPLNNNQISAVDESAPSWRVLDNLRLVSDGTRLVTHKRQFIIFNATLNHTVLRHWLEYRSGNQTLVYHFPRTLFEQLPLEEPQWQFKTCAVVGNSGVVLLKENGKEIDAHDAVIRMNIAPVRGYEAYVGSKTTFNVVNSHNIKELLQGQRKWRTTDDSAHLVMFETASNFARYHLCQPLLKRFSHANPILLNPVFSNQCHKLWVQLKHLLEQKQERETEFHRKPMSGFFATLLGLQMCDHVNLYGFDAYTSKRRSYRYHYFDNVQGFTDVHSFDLAIAIYKLMARKGKLTIKS